MSSPGVIADYRSLIKALGPQSAVGRMLGVPRRNVWWWLHKGAPSKVMGQKILSEADRLKIGYDQAWAAKWVEGLT